MKQTLYCEINFLEKFFANIPPHSPLEDDSTKYDNWLKYRELFWNDCQITVDSREKYIELVKSNEALLKLKKRHDGGYINIQFGTLNNSLNVNLHTIYFIYDTSSCQKYEDDYGMLFISNDSLSKYADILFTDGLDEINSSTKLWDFIDKYKHPCNNITLYDRYIFSKDADTVKREFKSLFNKLLPQQYNKIFNITIVSQDFGDIRTNTHIKEVINGCISSLRKYEIKLHIRLLKRAPHDRELYTNYCYLRSGHGFVFTQQERSALSTTLSKTPITNNTAYNKITKSLNHKVIK